MKSVENILKLIKEHTGLELKKCDNFTGVHVCKCGKKYFNIETEKPIFESKEYDILLRFADKYNIISVEPNGNKRLAIFFLN